MNEIDGTWSSSDGALKRLSPIEYVHDIILLIIFVLIASFFNHSTELNKSMQ